jgi:hypothetical protein
MYYDKVEGNLIFSQVNVPPFVSTPSLQQWQFWLIRQAERRRTLLCWAQLTRLILI